MVSAVKSGFLQLSRNNPQRFRNFRTKKIENLFKIQDYDWLKLEPIRIGLQSFGNFIFSQNGHCGFFRTTDR